MLLLLRFLSVFAVFQLSLSYEEYVSYQDLNDEMTRNIENSNNNNNNGGNNRKYNAEVAQDDEEEKGPMEWEKSGLFEGDIMEGLHFRNGLRDFKARWYGGIIPYTFHYNITWEERMKIQDALEVFCERTCVIFRPKYALESLRDFIVVTNDDSGCWSLVGKQGGPQQLNLAKSGCMTNIGNIRHEFMHALGFEHQHTDSCRDDFLDIKWDNIEAGREKNFKKHSEGEVTNYGQVYDYESVMHYSRYAFTKNNETTMEPKEPGVSMGHKKNLSKIDIIKINKMYNCKESDEQFAEFKREARAMDMGTCAYKFYLTMKARGYNYK